MSAQCGCGSRSPYFTGIAPKNLRLLRPGGLALTEHAIELAGLAAGARILDVGCGSGQTLQFLQGKGFDAIGIDCEPAGNEAGEGTGAVTRLVGRAEALPFPENSFDGVIAECSLSLAEDLGCALAECGRVLKENGCLIVSDLYARNPDAIARVRALASACVASIFVKDELLPALSRHGFVVEVWEDHSKELREQTARFIFEHGSLHDLWDCDGPESHEMEDAVRGVRAGYFLSIARLRSGSQTGGRQ